MTCCQDIINDLRQMAANDVRDHKAHFGINTERALGVTVKDLRAYAKRIGKDHQRAAELWQTGVHEARLLACLVAQPKKLDRGLMEEWVKDFDSWDICDICCMSLLRKHPKAYDIAVEWSRRPEEFVRRAGLVLMTTLAVHDKKAPDYHFIQLLPHITAQAADERGYVKKAVSWALRQIGKRNLALNAAAIRAPRGTQAIGQPQRPLDRLGCAAGTALGKIARRLAR